MATTLPSGMGFDAAMPRAASRVRTTPSSASAERARSQSAISAAPRSSTSLRAPAASGARPSATNASCNNASPRVAHSDAGRTPGMPPLGSVAAVEMPPLIATTRWNSDGVREASIGELSKA